MIPRIFRPARGTEGILRGWKNKMKGAGYEHPAQESFLLIESIESAASKSCSLTPELIRVIIDKCGADEFIKFRIRAVCFPDILPDAWRGKCTDIEISFCSLVSRWR